MPEAERNEIDRLQALRRQIGELRQLVAAEGRRIFLRWRPYIRRASFAASALNLAHYRALRRRNVRSLQRSLMRFGLSSLGRLEGRVLPTLDAVAAALQRMDGSEAASPIRFPSERQFFRGETGLRANARDLFGPAPAGRETRILVTLPSDAALSPTLVVDLAKRGMDVVRINCAHDDETAWAAMVGHVREVEKVLGRRIRVLMDIAGPKCRTEQVWTASERKILFPGDRLLLCKAETPETGQVTFRATCSIPEVIDRLRVGARVYVDDGQLAGQVELIDASGAVLLVARTKQGGARLKSQKGLNFPDTDLGLRPLTAKDLKDLDFICRHADLIAYSFVETAAHIKLLQEELSKRRSDWRRLGLVAKIETPRAVRNLPDLMVQAAGRQPFGMMIARGDLAVELGFERMAEMQEELLWLCEAAHIPVIWATQVLESLVKTGMPSRGDMTDAAMAGRAECVMLNKGPHVSEAIGALDGLLRRMAEHQSKKTPRLRALRSW